MNYTVISIVLATVLIGGALMLVNNNGQDATPQNANVRVVDGTQIITITAKGGYAPRATLAQAGIPTMINIATNGTFDCSSSLSIPALPYRVNLPPSGTTEISVPPQPAGASLRGLCSMGMYSFSISFQ